MDLPDDVMTFVGVHFSGSDHAEALSLLREAKIHDGSYPDDRLLRCAVMASRGNLDRLKSYTSLLAIDWRDVVVAGEYEMQGKSLVWVRDLSQPLQV